MNAPRLQLDLRESAALKLTSAVLLYQASGHAGRSAYASVHDVAMEHGHATLLAGKPLLPRAALELARSLSPTELQSGFLPAHVLYAQEDFLMWWQRACRRHIAFRCDNPCIGVRGGVVPHPALLFCAGRHGWRVWALRTNSRPQPETQLYQAPYFNVNSEGVICSGSAGIPRSTMLDQTGAWSEAFFRSQFTHANVPKLVAARGGAHAFWRALLERPPKTFPQRLLLPLERTLAEQVQHMAQAR